MSWIIGSIKWIMTVSRTLTATTIYAVIGPEATLSSTLGEELTGSDDS